MPILLSDMNLILSIISNLKNIKDLIFGELSPGEKISQQLVNELRDHFDKTFEGIEAQRRVAYALQSMISKYGMATSLRKEYDKLWELATQSKEIADSVDKSVVANFWFSQRIMIDDGHSDDIENALIRPIKQGTTPFIDEETGKELKKYVNAFTASRERLRGIVCQADPGYDDYLTNIQSTKSACLGIESKLNNVAERLVITLGFGS